MVRTAATKTVGGKTLRKAPTNKSTKVGRSSYEKGGNRLCHRETPSWQQPISNFLPSTQTENSMQTEDPPSASQKTALRGFLDGRPVETVVNADILASNVLGKDKKGHSADINEQITDDFKALKGFLDGKPVEIVVNANVQPPNEDNKHKDDDIKPIPDDVEKEADKNPSISIKYEELVKHVHFLESLP